MLDDNLRQATRAGFRHECFVHLPQNFIRAENQAESEDGDDDFSDGADHERAETLFAEFADVGAQADSSEGEQERPARKIGEAAELVFAEDLRRGDGRDGQKAQDEFREFVPEECGLVADLLVAFFTRPVDGVAENDKADHGVAGGLGQHGDFSGGVRIQISRGGDFGGVVDSEAGPEAVAQVAEMQPVADQRENEKADRAERKNCGDGVGSIFIVGVDGALWWR